MAQHRAPILCVDVGSTWTKAALVAADGSFRTAQRPTDAGRTDVALALDRLRWAVVALAISLWLGAAIRAVAVGNEPGTPADDGGRA